MMWRFGLIIAGLCLCGNIAYAADAHQHHGGRLLQDCSSISRRKQCRNTTGCQWNGRRLGCGPIPTSPPSALPVSLSFIMDHLSSHNDIYFPLTMLLYLVLCANNGSLANNVRVLYHSNFIDTQPYTTTYAFAD